MVLKKTLESPLDCKIKPLNPKGNQSWIFIGRTDAEAEAPIFWSPDAKNWLIGKDLVCWERLKAGGEGDDRGRDGWMASRTWWTWIWAISGSWWWTRKPGMLQSMGWQRVRHEWATELNWILKQQYKCHYCILKAFTINRKNNRLGKWRSRRTKWLAAMMLQRLLPWSSCLTIFGSAEAALWGLKSIKSCLNFCTICEDVTYKELKNLLKSKKIMLIDVREPWEIHESGKIPGSVNIPCKWCVLTWFVRKTYIH